LQGPPSEAEVGTFVAGELALVTATPLFQTNFFPDLIQVNFMPLEIVVAPALLQELPARIAAEAGRAITDPKSRAVTIQAILFRMPKGYYSRLCLSIFFLNCRAKWNLVGS
jgi:hypothetical protein